MIPHTTGARSLPPATNQARHGRRRDYLGEVEARAAEAERNVSRAMVKLHARDRAQLVVFAYESGLVKPG